MKRAATGAALAILISIGLHARAQVTYLSQERFIGRIEETSGVLSPGQWTFLAVAHGLGNVQRRTDPPRARRPAANDARRRHADPPTPRITSPHK